MSITEILEMEIIGDLAGGLIGVGICLLYIAYRLHLDEREYKQIRANTKLIIESMKKEHERKMDHMHFMNKTGPYTEPD